MKSITNLVEQALIKYTAETEINTTLASNLEFRLLFSIDFSKPFKEAKKDFIRKYFNNLLVMSFGNVSRCADLAHLNRRHVHRILIDLNIEVDNYRRELIKPYNYIKDNVQQVLEKAIQDINMDKKIKSAYNSDDLSSLIANNIDAPLSYDEAVALFEKEFIEHVLKEVEFDLKKASEVLDMSERTLYRKLSKLGIRV